MDFSNQNILNDNQSVISDITETIDNNTVTSFDIEKKMSEITVNMNNELNKLNLDILKEKAKELGITGISKLKKPEIIQNLETEFLKLFSILKEKKLNDLKSLCKQCGIKGIAGNKKDILIYQILQNYSSNLKFKVDSIQTQNDIKNIEKENTSVKICSNSLSLIEQLEKQKQEIELKMKEETKRQQDEKKQKEETKRQEDEERNKKEIKNKKQSIPKNVRIIIWNNYIGEDIIKHKCLCCKKVTISNTNYEVGHVMSEKNGGTHEINNLRPICFSCNHSMGSENMIDFVVKFGLFIG
jgi:5-methylcytosine-specific restriction endonuclease McrA